MSTTSATKTRSEWLEAARARLAQTERELTMTRSAWERLYGRWPGERYAECLRIQRDRETRNIARCEQALAAGLR